MSNVSELSITQEVHDQVRGHVTRNPHREVCGFIFGREGIGEVYRQMRNVHHDPGSNFAMDDNEVVDVMKFYDAIGHRLMAVMHSHPKTAAIPSNVDAESADTRTPLLIASPRDNRFEMRAWRFYLEFIGVSPTMEEIVLDIVEDLTKADLTPPITPWALTPGNRILITYTRPNSPRPRTIATRIARASLLRHDEKLPRETKSSNRPRINLEFDPLRGTDPRSMLVERIKSVKVLEESPQAGKVRDRASSLAYGLSDYIKDDDFAMMAKSLAYLNATFPEWLMAS